MTIDFAQLLAEHVNNWDADTTEDGKTLDLMEARLFLRAFIRILSLEDIIERLAIRIHESNSRKPWEDLSPEQRNAGIFIAMNVLDALRDELNASIEQKG